MDDYFNDLSNLFAKIKVTDVKGKPLSFARGISEIINLIITQNKKGNKIMLIGNGGSASIASHIATDFLKNVKISAIAFNDSSLITCLSNDLGYEYVFEKPIAMLAKKGDILFSISSSGKSKNILNATKKAKIRGCFVITLSGFMENSSLRRLGDINFYVPSHSYGFVEIIHLTVCHCIADKISKDNKPIGSC